jgi:hypothetical protein
LFEASTRRNGVRLLRQVPAGARTDLLRVLTSPSNVRADVIRQFHERREERMVDVLADLEADDLLREQVVLLLQSVQDERR